jgi:twinkle protein
MNNYEDYGIEIPRGKYSGEVVTICPECSHTRKKKKDKCLGVNLDKKVWNCNHCGWKGTLITEKKKEYIKPIFTNRTNLGLLEIDWFAKRGISNETLNHFKITKQMEWMPQVNKEVNTIGFNYFRNDELINTKFRDGAKNFKLVKDAELIFFNLNALKESSEVYICEGEIDCITFHQTGLINVISVPNGANLNSNNMVYLENCLNELSEIKRFHIATDNDTAGRKLRNDLAQRLGIEKCDYIIFGDCKDANECLQKYGIEKVVEFATKPINFPLEGSFTISDFEDEIDDFYRNGLPDGAKCGVPDLDQKISFHEGYISTFTGIPSHGKTSFLDYLLVRLLLNEDWGGAFYSPENKPTKLHFSKIARIIMGKSWDGEYKMSFDDVQLVKEYLEEKYWFIKPEKDFTLDSILSSVLQLISRKGIKFFVIDAWNKLEHLDDSTGYVGKQLDKLANFCELHQVHCFLVAHPTKMKKMPDGLRYEVPTLYDISGSANFFNKTDAGFSMYRDFQNNTSTLHIQKVKFNHWGETGSIDFNYDLQSCRYYVVGSNPDRTPYIRRSIDGQIMNLVRLPKDIKQISINDYFEPAPF